MTSTYTPIERDVQASANNSGGNIPDSARHPQINDRSGWIDRLKESSHPVALLFFILFRLSPVFVYIFGTIFISMITKQNRFILHFIFIILLISVDFWNIKNIAGRLLVGLRWWNEINVTNASTGEFENVWVFETANPDRYINPIDSKVFWLLIYFQPVAWGILAILAILKFEFLYFLLTIIAFALSFTNALAFTKCDKFGKANSIASDFIGRSTANLFSRFNPFSRQ